MVSQQWYSKVEAVAVVGSSGSGKGTIPNLLERFYDPRGGAVFIDGRDVRTLTQESVRARIGVVFQDPQLLEISVSDSGIGMRPQDLKQLFTPFTQINHPANRGGMTKVIEAVRQLRGQAHPKVQVPNLEFALANGIGGFLGSRHGAATLIMKRV